MPFVTREVELTAIKTSIESHEHIVLVAPRRYGKSTLITQVLKEKDFPSVCIDLFFVLAQAEVAKTVIEGVSTIIDALLLNKSAYHKIIASITALNPKLIVNMLGLKAEITTKQTTEKTISDRHYFSSFLLC